MRPPLAVPGRPNVETRQALLRLLGVVALVVLAALATGTTDVLVVVAAIVVMIMVHELGHFVAAKWSGMKVTEYFLGFGPRLWSIRRGETEYGVKAIPAGGYVKIVGMSNLDEVDAEDEARSYRQQPFHNRLLVAVAGSFMHLVMALLLVWGLLTFVGDPYSSNARVQVGALHSLAGGSDPAAKAGIRPGDVIVSVDGRTIDGFTALTNEIRSGARPLRIVVARAGRLRHLSVMPEAVAVPATAGHPSSKVEQIGIDVSLAPVAIGPLRGALKAPQELGRMIGDTFAAFGSRFSPHALANFFDQVANSKAANLAARQGTRPESIFGAVRTAAQGAQAGVGDLLLVLVSINLFLGIFNMFPMLPLDGGHVLIAVYERVRSRRGRRYRADVAKLAPFAYAFLAFLGVFVLTAVYLDVTHPVANPFK